jgi:hypothetical protein
MKLTHFFLSYYLLVVIGKPKKISDNLEANKDSYISDEIKKIFKNTDERVQGIFNNLV